jgi:NAD(P)H-flavin reductase
LPNLKYPDPRGDRRAFNIVSSPAVRGKISILFRQSETGFKKGLIELSEGASVTIRGPLGSVFTIDKSIGPAFKNSS